MVVKVFNGKFLTASAIWSAVPFKQSKMQCPWNIEANIWEQKFERQYLLHYSEDNAANNKNSRNMVCNKKITIAIISAKIVAWKVYMPHYLLINKPIRYMNITLETLFKATFFLISAIFSQRCHATQSFHFKLSVLQLKISHSIFI